MKTLSQIKVNANQLKLIIGENINFPFPTKMVTTAVGKEVERKQPESLAAIIAGSDWANKRSHDERFDNKHPVILATDHIKQNGLSKTIVAKIRNDYKSQKAKKIAGSYKILNDIISDPHREFIENLLTETHNANVEKFGSRHYNK